MQPKKTLRQALAGLRNIRFADMTKLVEAFGFNFVRQKGSHHIFSHPDVPKLVNLQNVHGQAKPYQIRQFLRLVEQLNLHLDE